MSHTEMSGVREGEDLCLNTDSTLLFTVTVSMSSFELKVLRHVYVMCVQRMHMTMRPNLTFSSLYNTRLKSHCVHNVLQQEYNVSAVRTR